MKVEKRFIKGIIDELLANALESGAEKIDISVEQLPDTLRISVSDNGKGMPNELRERVFITLNQERRGEFDHYYGELAGESIVGRGLNIVGMMVDHAEVESAVGEGTTVTVYRKTK